MERCWKVGWIGIAWVYFNNWESFPSLSKQPANARGRIKMNRSDWLLKTRGELEKQYDADSALYDEKWGIYPNQSQLDFMGKLLSLLPPQSTILDAACGAGRYMPIFLEKGHKIVGIDQSQGMLSRVQSKFPAVQTQKVGLQEMTYSESFDAVICVDAMEHIFPEDWIPILNNFHRALKPLSYLYFTVELAAPNDIEESFRNSQRQGLPLVYGEWMNEDCYHYYPTMEQVREWIQQAGFDLKEEGEGDGYHHFIVQKT
jgi:cyclopropane fatty-acyl-phospholipid synthase-like methyltransferase